MYKSLERDISLLDFHFKQKVKCIPFSCIYFAHSLYLIWHNVNANLIHLNFTSCSRYRSVLLFPFYQN